MRTVNMLEAKTHLSKLVEAVESGAEDEIILARDGKPAARLTAVQSKRPIRLGLAKGIFKAPENFDELNPEIEKLAMVRMSEADILDTHIAVWAVLGDNRLTPRAMSIIAEADKSYVSVASIWEVAIKRGRRRGSPNDFPFSAAESVELFDEAGFQLLDILPAHVIAVENLPPIHRDPFDRLLIAQSIAEPLRLMTGDAVLAEYSDLVLLI